ncbi:hypothetical protein B0H11DRAFT_2244171 [Mycena galericulata]|nr:hypothetical protein B0H11DRAFT_2244171 [Mycena galericulata]
MAFAPLTPGAFLSVSKMLLGPDFSFGIPSLPAPRTLETAVIESPPPPPDRFLPLPQPVPPNLSHPDLLPSPSPSATAHELHHRDPTRAIPPQARNEDQVSQTRAGVGVGVRPAPPGVERASHTPPPRTVSTLRPWLWLLPFYDLLPSVTLPLSATIPTRTPTLLPTVFSLEPSSAYARPWPYAAHAPSLAARGKPAALPGRSSKGAVFVSHQCLLETRERFCCTRLAQHAGMCTQTGYMRRALSLRLAAPAPGVKTGSVTRQRWTRR